MSDDLLEAATRALRDEGAADDADGRFTRARVMASLHQGRVKRRTRLAFILPLAACLAAGTAWGAATGRLPAVFRAVGQFVGYAPRAPEPAPRAATPSVRGKSAAPGAASSAAAAAMSSPPAEPVATPVAEPKLEPVAPAPPAPASSLKAAASASAAFRDSDGDLYQLAHQAHFTEHDYARALAGWSAYLEAAPNGRFSIEARYNRAICLLRLGRDAEARQALEPFAAGKLGYRQAEARKLLDELSR
jgi:TolA-binding protein